MRVAPLIELSPEHRHGMAMPLRAAVRLFRRAAQHDREASIALTCARPIALVVLISACAHARSQTAIDPRIAMEFRASPITLCESMSTFAAVAVGWTGAGAPPSQDPPDLTWTSADTAIVTVNQNGELLGKKPGSTTVSALVKWGALFGSKDLVVHVRSGRLNNSATTATGATVCGD